MGFATLALIGVAGLAGPLLAAWRGRQVPVVAGELLVGILLGPTLAGWIRPADPALALLANIGFALVMFVAGSHVPVRDPRLRAALGTGALRAVAVGLLAVAAGYAVAALFGIAHAALYAVLMASSSAALVLPALGPLDRRGPGAPSHPDVASPSSQDAEVPGRSGVASPSSQDAEVPGRSGVASPGRSAGSALALVPQVALADAACIVALPLAIDPGRAGTAALGAVAVIGCAALVLLAMRALDRKGLRRRMHRLSQQHKFALELRVDLTILFALAALATWTHVSIMLAGFAFGLVMAAVGEPRRLARQVFGVTEGFFGPLFFVWLGASLDLRDLGRHPALIGLGVALGGGAIAVHAAMRATGQPVAYGVLAAAQLGVPVAAATIGTQLGLLHPGEAAAIVLGALLTVAAAVLAAAVIRPSQSASSPSATPSPPPVFPELPPASR